MMAKQSVLTSAFAGFVLLSGALLWATPAAAEVSDFDSIVAVVNDDVVLYSELQDEMQRLAAQIAQLVAPEVFDVGVEEDEHRSVGAVGQGLHLKSSINYLGRNTIVVTPDLADDVDIAVGELERVVIAHEDQGCVGRTGLEVLDLARDGLSLLEPFFTGEVVKGVVDAAERTGVVVQHRDVEARAAVADPCPLDEERRVVERLCGPRLRELGYEG